MKISEIKEKLPAADVYEIDPHCKYLLLIPRTALSQEVQSKLPEQIRSWGFPVGVIVFHESADPIRLLEVKE